jgi:ectoine hydroxylase-related dioxygenase (phytanoyl-CoA dioxygenase family)
MTVLTAEQVGAFDRDGFLAIDALTDDDEVAALCDAYDELFQRTSGFADGDRIDLVADGERGLLPQILNPERYVPTVVQGHAYRNATAIALQLLGAGCRPTGNHAILKHAGHGAATPWHQDEAYWNPRYAHHAISIWLALQPATLDNGCMQFVAGSHGRAVLPHELVAPDSHALQLVDHRVPGQATACEIPAGGATIHAGRTLHYAGPNVTDHPRRALIFGFGLTPALLDTPNDYPWQRPEWFTDAA